MRGNDRKTTRERGVIKSTVPLPPKGSIRPWLISLSSPTTPWSVCGTWRFVSESRGWILVPERFASLAASLLSSYQLAQAILQYPLQ